jgi:hypothetical protein
MSLQPPQNIHAFLQQHEVQEHIHQSMHDAHAKATVTISIALNCSALVKISCANGKRKGLSQPNGKRSLDSPYLHKFDLM